MKVCYLNQKQKKIWIPKIYPVIVMNQWQRPVILVTCISRNWHWWFHADVKEIIWCATYLNMISFQEL